MCVCVCVNYLNHVATHISYRRNVFKAEGCSRENCSYDQIFNALLTKFHGTILRLQYYIALTTFIDNIGHTGPQLSRE